MFRTSVRNDGLNPSCGGNPRAFHLKMFDPRLEANGNRRVSETHDTARSRRHFPRPAGFTLVELLVVVVILATTACC